MTTKPTLTPEQQAAFDAWCPQAPFGLERPQWAQAAMLAAFQAGWVQRGAHEWDGWQPIETAPRDGTRILLALGKKPIIVTGHWETYTGVVPGDHDGWVDDYGHDFPYRQDLFTCWTPLPGALSSTTGEG